MTISVDRIYGGYEGTCDTPGCTGWQVFHVTSAIDMESRLEATGWETTAGRHLCPECVESRMIVDMEQQS